MKGNDSWQDSVYVNIGTAQVRNSKSQKLLSINIDSKLTFENHINRICKKARANLNALSGILYYVDPLKWQLLVNAFFKS